MLSPHRVYELAKLYSGLKELDPKLTLDHLGLKAVLCDLELISKGNTKAKELPTPVVEGYISNLAVYMKCIHKV